MRQGIKATAGETKSEKKPLTMTVICQKVLNVLDTYWSTFLGAVDRRNFHGVEARVWISLMQAVDSVTQLSFKVLNQRLAWAQHCHPLEQTHLCLLYTHTHINIGQFFILQVTKFFHGEYKAAKETMDETMSKAHCHTSVMCMCVCVCV